MAFPFAAITAPAEPPGKRLEWERHILGQPLSVHPAELVTGHAADRHTLEEMPLLPGRSVQVAVTRLPGWTGGKGFFVGDPTGFVVAIPREGMASPRPWQPLLAHGRWQVDDLTVLTKPKPAAGGK